MDSNQIIKFDEKIWVVDNKTNSINIQFIIKILKQEVLVFNKKKKKCFFLEKIMKTFKKYYITTILLYI